MNKLISILSVFLLIVVLTGCAGFQVCEKRINNDADYIEHAAVEYGLVNYRTDSIYFTQAEIIGAEVTGEKCSLTDSNHHVLVSHELSEIQILVVPECEEDDIYYYEGSFMKVALINQVLEDYNLNHDTPITVGEESQYVDKASHYQYVNPSNFNLSSFIVYYIGDIRDDEGYYDRVGIVLTEGGIYQLTTNVYPTAEASLVEVLLEFTIENDEIQYINN